MKTKLLPLLLFCLLAVSCRDTTEPDFPPQPDDSFIYELHLGGELEDEAQSAIIRQGNIFIVGTSNSFSGGNGDSNIYFLKTNEWGATLTEKSYGGSNAEEGFNLVSSQNNSITLVGTTKSYGNGGSDIYVLQVDENGQVIWSKTYGGELDDKAAQIIELTSGDLCIVGTTESQGAGARDIYLLWIDQDGNLLKELTFGGVDNDGGKSIIEQSNGDLVVYGYTHNFGATSRDLYLMRITPNGEVLWSKRYGGDSYEESQAICQTADGGFVMNGHSASTDINHNMYGLKVDREGNLLWEKNFGGTSHEGGEALLIDSKGQYVFIGRTNSFGAGEQDIYQVITDADGNFISDKIFGNTEDDKANYILEHQSSYYIFGSSITSRLGFYDKSLYVIIQPLQ